MIHRLPLLQVSRLGPESRPTWERLVSRSGVCERTVARWLQELRVRGWLAHLERGSTPAHRPMVLAHMVGNRAAVYGLRIPLTPAEALNRALEQLAQRLAENLATRPLRPTPIRRPLTVFLPSRRRPLPPSTSRPALAPLVQAVRARPSTVLRSDHLTSNNLARLGI
jgi:hypothetical protein